MNIKSRLPEIVKLFDAGNSPRQIAEVIGTTAGHVRVLLNWTRPGCVRQQYEERFAAARPSGNTTDEIAVRVLRGEPVRQISREAGLTYGAVWQIGRRYGMRKKTAVKRDRAVEMARRWERGESQSSIARAFGLSQVGVSKAIRRVSGKAVAHG